MNVIMKITLIKRRKTRVIQGAILLIGLSSLVAWQQFGNAESRRLNDQSLSLKVDFYKIPSRHLTSLPNCTPRAIEQFPKGLFTNFERQHGAIILHILSAVYMFLGFALILSVHDINPVKQSDLKATQHSFTISMQSRY
ncbi:hypothetical protein KUTeg_005354 [Tegillarca granosa]|uniref:Uncharacterized protein n=1 Tax=Tegillarca granosa TaxID=220873 RepID=A0ABQ9FJI8_TEGGR|nr:hypothetical protein KUTeg_005354 [Tegillarca granosa]